MNTSVMQWCAVAAASLLGRVVRTIRGVLYLRRTWRCAWILAERQK